jgi:parvulin-like peptidyl-prolyl isomerase
MTRLIKVLLVLSTLTAVALVSGCGRGDGSVVARVGDGTITAAELNEFVERNAIGFRSAEDEFEGKRSLLDSMISHTLLVQAAYERKIDQSPEIQRILASNRDPFMLDALYEHHIGSNLEIGEAELRQTYADLEYEVRAFHIVVMSEDTANMIFERLQNGENFEQLAHQFSADPRARRNRGDMGYFTRGTGPDEFEKVVFALEVGETTPPFATAFGWHLVKVVDKKINNAREEYTRMRPVLKQQLSQQKRQLLTQAYFDTIAARYPVTIDEGVVSYVIHKRNNLYPPQVVAQLPKYDFDDDQLDRDEKELVLATWDGGQMTLIEYLLSVRRWLPPEQRPNLEDYDSVAAVIYRIKQKDILIQQASLENMGQSEDFKHNMKLFERYTLAEVMRNDSIPVPPPPSEQELRDHYDQHREEYLMPAQVHLYEIMVSDEQLASQLARSIESLDEFQAKALQFTERAAMRVKRGDLGYIDNRRFPELYAAAKGTSNNSIGGPIKNRGKYSIIWPVRWTEETYMDFLTVKEDIAEQLTKNDRNQAVVDWLEQRRREVDIEIYDDAIRGTIDEEYYAEVGGVTGTP